MMISFQGTPLEILGTQQVTPSELLVALLKRSAELGHFTQLEWGQFPDTGWMWIADIKHQQGTGQTPLDAVLAAVQALQERTNE
jgi:hypothetical protein